jgi:hypothetical protein
LETLLRKRLVELEWSLRGLIRQSRVLNPHDNLKIAATRKKNKLTSGTLRDALSKAVGAYRTGTSIAAVELIRDLASIPQEHQDTWGRSFLSLL